MNIRKIQVLTEAENDLESGRIFYENQEQGIGSYFWDSLISDIQSLTIYGGIHSKIFGYYRMTSKRFPYSIYYDLKGDTAFVIAVLPEKRNPDWLCQKLTNNR
ncbi:type II toxin-antitoxin system RelE/ParE family toxin [Thiomicrorhabdus indica]|uniref:type II toxin-antitoxin system RelE/ParE family toxin n=1 Tax=Thiomicrorhabdus indica TaxID=2267253 RepID=UPI00102DD05D|nr:type II toxin-antitoxin system RelE/ParE family toxin [Thiomicrorhabdus indica]